MACLKVTVDDVVLMQEDEALGDVEKHGDDLFPGPCQER